jgi:hypothetical protein
LSCRLNRIKDNPVPVEFPITVVGAKLHVDVRLDEGTPVSA